MRRQRGEELLARAACFDAWAATRSSVREVDPANLHYPPYVSRASGGYIWDLDGNRYVDLVLGYGPVILGHAHPQVEAAVVRTLADGVCMSPMWSPLQAELTELLVRTIPHAERAYLMKTGSDATSAAVRLTRIFTSRDKVLKWGYNGWHDWTISRPAGIPDVVRRNTLHFEFNDLESLEAAFLRHPQEIACVIMMPFELDIPRPDFLRAVRDTAHRHGALFILDDMRAGFRVALGGSQEYFAVRADLATFSKAMANGFPISAVVGRADILDGLSQTHMASTFYTTPAEMAAAIETISILRDTDALGKVRRVGDRFSSGISSLIDHHRIPVSLRGLSSSPFIEFPTETPADVARKVTFYEVTLEHGLMLHPNHQWYFCAAHTDDDIDQALDACKAGFEAAFERDLCKPSAAQ